MSWYAKATQDSNILHWLNAMVMFNTQVIKQKLPGTKYSHPDQFFLERGTFFESQPLTPDEQVKVRQSIGNGKQFKMKECYYNAQVVAQKSDFLQYVEGYCYTGLIPVGHAWNTINGKVVDVTMAHSNGEKPIAGVFPEGWEYFGTDFNISEIRKMWAQHGMSYPIISWEMQYQHLKDNYPEEPKTEVEDELV